MTITLPTIGSTFGDDTPRARRSDPVESHTAADRSARTRRTVMDKVVDIVRAAGLITGSEINEAYDRLQRQNPALPKVHWDSPRKRVSDLIAEKRIEVVSDGVRGHERYFRAVER